MFLWSAFLVCNRLQIMRFVEVSPRPFRLLECFAKQFLFMCSCHLWEKWVACLSSSNLWQVVLDYMVPRARKNLGPNLLNSKDGLPYKAKGFLWHWYLSIVRMKCGFMPLLWALVQPENSLSQFCLPNSNIKEILVLNKTWIRKHNILNCISFFQELYFFLW